MRTHHTSSGFALLLALSTLAMLSAIALTLAATAGTEVRVAQDSWNTLQAERLAKSGHEVAAYLETRGLGTMTEDLAGLPVQAVVMGMTYSVSFDGGTTDIVLEGENGKFDVTSAKEEDVAAFFNAWTGDSDRSREIAASIADWVDYDDEARPFGAEAEWYLKRGYRPRNAALGSADLFLIKGITTEDLSPAILNSDESPALRPSLLRLLTLIPTGNRVNPNYASPTVLKTIPGMTPALLQLILNTRQHAIFRTQEDFQKQIGLPPDSAMLNRLAFDRGNSPAVVAVARLKDSPTTWIERRIQNATRFGPSRKVLSLVERHAQLSM
jgi:type II secretory pathway component PulK